MVLHGDWLAPYKPLVRTDETPAGAETIPGLDTSPVVIPEHTVPQRRQTTPSSAPPGLVIGYWGQLNPSVGGSVASQRVQIVQACSRHALVHYH